MSLTDKQVELINLLKATLPTAPAEVAQNNVTWYPEWKYAETIKRGTRHSDKGRLYECLHDLNEGNNLNRPSETPSIWKEVWTEPYPEWKQPLGAHDAYKKGDGVTHKGKKWTSDVDANVWEPGAYGWTEVK